MWQRIQSVFLGIVILSLIAGLFFPAWIGGDAEIEYRLYPIYFMIKQNGQNGQLITSQFIPYSLTSILMVAAITIGILQIRKYTDRILQGKLGTFNSLLLAGALICEVLFSNQMTKAYHVPWKYDYCLWLTFVAVICNWLAIRFIRRDEKLVRDSERIR